MSFAEKVTDNPIEKFIKFDRFPSKMLTHLLIALLSSYLLVKTLDIRPAY